MTCICRTHLQKSQPFPIGGVLATQSDLRLSDLWKIKREYIQRPLYAYVVPSVEYREGQFLQTGSAPNFQGDQITLCTCKHKDRASPPKYAGPYSDDPWKGVWVAGLCSVSQFRPRSLFYLMLVEESYPGHRTLWNAVENPSEKSAFRNRHGDVYEPFDSMIGGEFSPHSYRPHLNGHVHDRTGRAHDIGAIYWNRHPRLLLGDIASSYLWTRPSIAMRDDDFWGSAHHKQFEHFGDFLKELV